MNEIAQSLGSSFERAPWGWALLASAIIALIKAWPTLSAQAIQERAARRKEKIEAAKEDKAEKATELSSCKERLDQMGRRLDTAEQNTHLFQMQLVGTLAAYRILDAEVETIAPQSSALRQARAAISTTFTIAPSTPPTSPAN